MAYRLFGRFYHNRFHLIVVDINIINIVGIIFVFHRYLNLRLSMIASLLLLTCARHIMNMPMKQPSHAPHKKINHSMISPNLFRIYVLYNPFACFYLHIHFDTFIGVSRHYIRTRFFHQPALPLCSVEPCMFTHSSHSLTKIFIFSTAFPFTISRKFTAPLNLTLNSCKSSGTKYFLSHCSAHSRQSAYGTK